MVGDGQFKRETISENNRKPGSEKKSRPGQVIMAAPRSTRGPTALGQMMDVLSQSNQGR